MASYRCDRPQPTSRTRASILSLFLSIAGIVPFQSSSGVLAETLPPLPSVEFGQTPAAVQPTTPAVPVRETVFQAPLPTAGQRSSVQQWNQGKRYRVYVNGDSSYLLQQVQRIEPRAFIQQYQGRQVIQAGVFGNEVAAKQQVATLANQGIGARITTDTLGMAPVLDRTQRSGYFVVVPKRRENLGQLQDQVLRLGIRRSAIRLRDSPYGPHLAVGPFAQLQQAEKIEGFLRDRGGMDARVHFQP